MWALMEVALITPIVMSVFRWTRYWPPGQVTLWLLLLILLPFNLARLFTLFSIPKEMQRNWMAILLLFTALLSIRTMLHSPNSLFDFGWIADFYRNLAEESNQQWTMDIGLFLFTCFLWWRGLRLIGRDPDINRIGNRFRIGSFIIVPIMIWMGTRLLLWDVLPFVLLFFASGLTAVALIRADQLERDSTGFSGSLTPSWISTIALIATAISFLAAFVAIFVGGDSTILLVGWTAPIWQAIRFGTASIIATFSLLALPIVEVFTSILNYLLALWGELISDQWRAVQDATAEQGPPPTGQPELFSTPTPTPLETTDGTKIGIILALIGITLIVTLALSRLYRQAMVAIEDRGQADGTRGIRPKRPSFAQQLLEKMGLFKGLGTAVSIRIIYWQMCRAAAGVGFTRSDSETPYEYQSTLKRIWPTNTKDVQTITNAYVQIRYGEIPESKEELDAIKAAWQRLEETEPMTNNSDSPVSEDENGR